MGIQYLVVLASVLMALCCVRENKWVQKTFVQQVFQLDCWKNLDFGEKHIFMGAEAWIFQL
jgi:hypothetical protein